MTLLYFACSRLHKGAGIWRKIWIVSASLFYLIPLRGLQGEYLTVLRNKGILPVHTTWEYNSLHDFIKLETGTGNIYYSSALRWDRLLLICWLAVAAGLLAYREGKYILKRRRLLKGCSEEEDRDRLETMDRLCGEMRVRRRVRLFYCHGMIPASMGFLRPVILLPEERKGKIPEQLLKHELAHIKNYDMLVHALISLTVTVHWFNPVVYLLQKEWKRVCELECDEAALRGCSGNERKAYAILLVEEAKRQRTGKGRLGEAEMQGASSLTGDARRLEERIEYIMVEGRRKGKFGACVSGIAFAAALFASSLTVFAYKETYYLERESETNAKMASALIPKGEYEVKIVPMGTVSLTQEVILYDEQFIDEDGNIYPVNREITAQAVCEHEYKVGIFMKHMMHADGSCRVEYYEAEHCMKCGNIKSEKYINGMTYDKCPHNGNWHD